MARFWLVICLKIMDDFKNKKVLIFGLGILGGGVAAANWFIKQGAKVMITDLKNREQLALSLAKLTGRPKLVLGSHPKKIFKENEIIVVNPDISFRNALVRYAQKSGCAIENEATIFYKYCQRPIIAVTGTRGKTTAANWIAYFLDSIVAGNSSVDPLLKILDRVNNPKNKSFFVVNELPSFHLEFFSPKSKAPEIVLITNIYQDHLNRYKGIEDYAAVKARIFSGQSKNKNLILNYDNKWTRFFLSKKPKSKVSFFSAKILPKGTKGVFVKNNFVYFQDFWGIKKVLNVSGFAKEQGSHNLENLLASALCAHLAGAGWNQIQKKIPSLPKVCFRQESVFKNKKLEVINDTTATSPDGAIAAVRRFSGKNTILICGGTDRDLDFKEWAKIAPKRISLKNFIFLGGSATEKMIRALGKKAKQIPVFESLEQCWQAALLKAKKMPKAVLLFSPGAKSFEKFKNEFDRGEQFNKLVRKTRFDRA